MLSFALPRCRWAMVLALFSLAAGAAPATHPATAPIDPAINTAGGEWAAFHGGGELRGHAKAIDNAPLALKWKFNTPGDEPAGFEGSPVIAQGVVYVADNKGTLYAVDLATGKQKWAFVTGSDPEKRDGFATTPLVVEGRVLLGDLGGTFYCVSATEGKKLWTFDAGSPIHSSANAAEVNGKVRIVFGDDGADIYCVNLADGSKAWDQKACDRINGSPAIGWGAAFVSGCDARLRAMRLTDGVEQFSADVGSVCPGSPALLADRIIIGTDGGKLVCFSADGKKEIWSNEKVGSEQMLYASPAVADGIVVAGARDRKVYGLDAQTGKILWTFATRGDVDSSPAISNGRVYVGSKDKNFYVLDLKTGKQLAKFPAARSITASPAVAEGAVLIADTAGNLYCYEPKSK